MLHVHAARLHGIMSKTMFCCCVVEMRTLKCSHCDVTIRIGVLIVVVTRPINAITSTTSSTAPVNSFTAVYEGKARKRTNHYHRIVSSSFQKFDFSAINAI